MGNVEAELAFLRKGPRYAPGQEPDPAVYEDVSAEIESELKKAVATIPEEKPVPTAIVHVEGSSQSARVLADGLAKEYEIVASELEDLGKEVVAAAERALSLAARANDDVKDILITIQRLRDKSKSVAQEIEQTSVVVHDAVRMSEVLRDKLSQSGRIRA